MISFKEFLDSVTPETGAEWRAKFERAFFKSVEDGKPLEGPDCWFKDVVWSMYKEHRKQLFLETFKVPNPEQAAKASSFDKRAGAGLSVKFGREAAK